MPGASITLASGRTVFATVGTTVSLMGAATFAAIVVTGFVAFSSWPDGAIRQVPGPVRLADPALRSDAGVSLAVATATSAAPEAAATSTAAPGDTPTPQLGRSVNGESGSGNAPVAAAATPSPQSPSGRTTPAVPAAPHRVADATAGAGEEVRRNIETAAVTTMTATGELLPRTSEVLEDWARGAAQSTSATAATVAEVLRILPRRQPAAQPK